MNHRQIVTNIHIKDNIIVFGCLFGKLFHFVIYDLEKRKRKYQTQSVSTYTLSYYFADDYIYVLMGNSQLICYDYEGKEVWKKFEPHYVVPGLSIYKKKLVYSSNNQIKITDGKNTEIINIPLVKVDKLEGMIGSKAYGVCSGKKNIYCFDVSKERIIYEVQGDPNAVIRRLLLTQGKLPGENKSTNVLFFSTDHHLNLVDIDKGSLQFHIGIPKIRDILHHDEIIVRTHTGESHLLRAVANAQDTIIEI